MVKTAVQELLEWLESDADFPGFNERYEAKKQEILEQEKKQIVNAYSYGWRLGMALHEHTPEDPEGYYNKTYITHGLGSDTPGANH
jgi:hypothetical protein